MTLIALGINHKTAPVALREKIAFAPEQLRSALSQLVDSLQLAQEAVIVSTCNRTELYLQVEHDDRVQAICNWLADFHRIDVQELDGCCYLHRNEQMVRHLMRVAAGLDSLVLGEPQILGQLKQAFHISQENGALSQDLQRLFQKTFAVAKRIRTETEIGSSAVSVAFAAVSLAKHIFGDLRNSKVLLIGAGETIGLVARHLTQQQISSLVIANRSAPRAQALVDELGGQVISLEQIGAMLPQVDLVIASTASPLPLVKQVDVKAALKARRFRPMLFVDLAVPRDIEASVGDLDDAYLYSVDDLQQIVEQNREARKQAAQQAEVIIEDAQLEFSAWCKAQQSVSLVRELRQQAQDIEQHLVTNAQRELASGVAAELVVERLAHKLTQALLHKPTLLLNQLSQQGMVDALDVVEQTLQQKTRMPHGADK